MASERRIHRGRGLSDGVLAGRNAGDMHDPIVVAIGVVAHPLREPGCGQRDADIGDRTIILVDARDRQIDQRQRRSRQRDDRDISA